MHTPNPQMLNADWQQGYGIQLWRSQHGYRGDGAFGQYMLVLPEQDAVVAIFSCIGEMQIVMDLVWELLLPGMHDGAVDGDDTELGELVSGLAMPTARERRGGSTPASIAPATCTPAPEGVRSHRSITSAEIVGDRVLLHEADDPLEVPLADSWTLSADGAVASSATVLDDGRLVVDVVLVHTPHRLEVTIDLAERTFTAVWPIVPLFGVGVDRRLSSMRLP
jgi:hypothetical protein